MRRVQIVLSLLTIVLWACSNDPAPSVATGTTSGDGLSAANDGITLTSAKKERVTGTFVDEASATTIRFDLARVGDDLFVDVTGNGGRPIIHIESTPDEYTFSYMGGALKLHATKEYVAQARAQAQTDPAGVSTDAFVFEGDKNVLDEMLQMPEVAQLPTLSRALGVRGITGNDFPASLAIHKMARQSAEALAIDVKPLEVPGSANGYCSSYPNRDSSCYGMCGPSCSCWGWVCGDCCYHYGCAVHDSWCRQGKWWYCYDITAVIALFGC